jgi:hypothetical protein
MKSATPERGRWLLPVTAACLLLVVKPAMAQVGDALGFLVTTQAVDTGDASRDRAAAIATHETLARSLVAALATLPLSSSSGGFAYRFNPALGTVERATDSFGPLFVERATMGGAGRASVAVTWQYASFSQLDGRSVGDGTLVTTWNRFVDEAQAFDVETLRLRVRANSLTVNASYGVTDRLEIAAALPFVSLSLDGERVDTYRATRFQQATASASTGRLADVLARGKYQVASGRWGGVAAGGDIRLPTGSEEDLLGAGEFGFREFAVVSVGSGPWSVHANVGLNQGGVSSGWDLSGAVTAAATPRLTLTGELLWRELDDIGRITASIAPHPTIAGVETLRLVPDGQTSSATGVIGMKWNIAGTWLLRASLLLPLKDAGLTPRAVPSVTLEYNVAR